MLLDTILSCLADPVKDIKLNFSSLLNNHTLMSEQQFYGIVLASALASRNTYLTIAIRELVVPYLEEKALQAVEAAATIMAMNNIYYRFTDLIDDEQYSKIPAGLRMNVMRDHGVDSIDFELWSLAVSVIN
ncbi:MAG: alkyl hydroperoxide reductase, partial [Burkholderiales bacterium]